MSITKVIKSMIIANGIALGHQTKENILPIAIAMLIPGILTILIKVEWRIIEFCWNLL